MSGGTDAGKPFLTCVEVSAGQGVQVGDHNAQHIQFIKNYIRNLIQPSPAHAGETAVPMGLRRRRRLAFQGRLILRTGV